MLLVNFYLIPLLYLNQEQNKENISKDYNELCFKIINEDYCINKQVLKNDYCSELLSCYNDILEREI